MKKRLTEEQIIDVLQEHESVLAALRRSRWEGDALTHDSRAVAAMLERSRRQG